MIPGSPDDLRRRLSEVGFDEFVPFVMEQVASWLAARAKRERDTAHVMNAYAAQDYEDRADVVDILAAEMVAYVADLGDVEEEE